MAQFNPKKLKQLAKGEPICISKKINYEQPNKALPFFLWTTSLWGLVLQEQTPADSWWLP